MIVEQVWTGNDYRNFNYLVACPETGEALAIDPLDVRKCLAVAEDRVRLAIELDLSCRPGGVEREPELDIRILRSAFRHLPPLLGPCLHDVEVAKHVGALQAGDGAH